MAIFFIRDWPGIGKLEIPLPELWAKSGDWGQVKDTKFGTNVSNEMLLNDAKCQDCSFYDF